MHIFIFLIAACHILNTVVVACLAYVTVFFNWRRYARERDRWYNGIMEVLEVYNMHYMANLSRGRSDSDPDAAKVLQPAKGASIDDLVAELNTRAKGGWSRTQSDAQPALTRLKQLYKGQLSKLRSQERKKAAGEEARDEAKDGKNGGGAGGPEAVAEGVRNGGMPSAELREGRVLGPGPVGEGADDLR